MSIEKGIFKSNRFRNKELRNPKQSFSSADVLSEDSGVKPKKTARMLDIEERTAVPIDNLIRDFYFEQKKTQSEIAQYFHISQRVLSQWMKNLGIPSRLSSETLIAPQTRERRNIAKKERDFRIKSKILKNINPEAQDNILLDLYNQEGSMRRVFQVFKSKGNRISEGRVARWIKDAKRRVGE